MTCPWFKRSAQRAAGCSNYIDLAADQIGCQFGRPVTIILPQRSSIVRLRPSTNPFRSILCGRPRAHSNSPQALDVSSARMQTSVMTQVQVGLDPSDAEAHPGAGFRKRTSLVGPERVPRPGKISGRRQRDCPASSALSTIRAPQACAGAAVASFDNATMRGSRIVIVDPRPGARVARN
jgi:hypothetical protein